MGKNDLAWRLVATIHMFFLIVNILSFIILPFTQSIWVWVPILTWQVNLIFGRNLDCPMTRLENFLRKRAGKPEISKFVKHYIIKNVVKLRKVYYEKVLYFSRKVDNNENYS